MLLLVNGDVCLLTNYIIEDKENNIELEFNYTEFTDLFNYTVEINEKNIYVKRTEK